MGYPGDFLEAIRQSNFKDQAIWFLNVSSYGHNNDSCEQVWKLHKKSVELEGRGEVCSDLSEFNAHRLLEFSKKAKTVKELRSFLEKVNHKHGQNVRVSLVELLIFIFDEDIESLSKIRSRCDGESLAEATAGLEILKTTLEYAISETNKAKERAKEARCAEEDAAEEEKKFMEAANAAKFAESLLKAAESEAQSHLDKLTREESKELHVREELENIIKDDSLGIVKRNKAKAELAILNAGDKTSVRKAKLEQENSIHNLQKAKAKAEKSVNHAQSMATAAERAKIFAHKSADEALQASKLSEEAIPIAKQALKNAHVILDKMKHRRKSGPGSLFYVNRELSELEKFMPKCKISTFRSMNTPQKKPQPTSSTPRTRSVEELRRMRNDVLRDL
mmetsp:Transcript_17129/g.22241  ORF Transcript_17129/g.22241 Transcript_17129/m.22241 type:complete len:392 (+) Transcript_17129:555-1730(+)